MRRLIAFGFAGTPAVVAGAAIRGEASLALALLE